MTAPQGDMSARLRSIDTETTRWAREAFHLGRKASLVQLALRPPLAFLHAYLVRGGIWRGTAGLVSSLLFAYETAIGLAKLAELELGPDGDRP